MITSWIASLGAWSWITFGLVLLVLEILAPGVFLLWIGIAALIVGMASLLLWDMAFWVWQVQTIVFLALTFVCVYVGNRYFRSSSQKSDTPYLNERVRQLVGRTATLAEPIENGTGRIHIGDTLWRVTGPDLPEGTRVRVKGVDADGTTLVVEAEGSF
ncbi:NfeD family protein [Limoniibacter endophyticus]|uniref:Membrane protein n=1 Tax=Limoniibacter endophyticus TaxID=1565040 RepID=A0A8J3GFP7_9HYPH|nr:NfeD family protein [Limoniibacter endophyticus]GHC64167.1 membrane protein [Limoniibacter endophyticus]